MNQIDFYKIYFENLSPTTFKVTKENNKIIIEDIDKPYPKGFNAKDVKQYPLLKETFMKEEFKKGGKVTWRDKYNKKYGYDENESHSLSDISKKTGVSKKGLQQIYNKGVGAFKTNPQSVRPNVTSKEQWGMGRVYSSVMGGKASKIDSKELKMKKGGLTSSQQEKVNYVMREFKKGDLKSSSGNKVTNRKQAIAIALSEANKYNTGGSLALKEDGSFDYGYLNKTFMDSLSLDEKLILLIRITADTSMPDDMEKLESGKMRVEEALQNTENNVTERRDNQIPIYDYLFYGGDNNDNFREIIERDYELLHSNYIFRNREIDAWFSFEQNAKDFLEEGYINDWESENDFRQDYIKIAESPTIVYYAIPYIVDESDGNLEYYFAIHKPTQRVGSFDNDYDFLPLEEEANSGVLYFTHKDFKSITGIDYKRGGKIYNRGGDITQIEIQSIKDYINNPLSNERLIESFKKILKKYEVETRKLSEFPVGTFVNTYDLFGYEKMEEKNQEMGIKYLLWGEYELVSKAIYEKNYSVWLYYNYIMRITISFDSCKLWFDEASAYYKSKGEMPIDAILKHTPKAKDGRSYAMWFKSSYEGIRQVTGETPTFQYRGNYYYQEIGMVGVGDSNKGHWSDYYREQKTGLTIPEYQKQGFSLGTLIHEFAHILDFQTQLLKKIEEKEIRDAKIKSGEIKPIELTDEEKKLYGSFGKDSDNHVGLPITTHYDEFSDTLINILQACANGSIPVTQLFEQQAVSVQNLLSGTYGDLILDARKKREKTAKNLKAMDEAENDKRFSFQKPMFSKIREYIKGNALLDSLKMKVSDSKKRPNLNLAEALEFDNLVSLWFEQNMRVVMAENPVEAKSVMNVIKNMKIETNRIINNHYDNIKNRFQFGFKPTTEFDKYLLVNCKNDFKDYKTWKECSKITLDEMLNK